MIELSSPSPAEPRHGGPSAALTREIFRSERQRARALAILLSLILLATLALFRAPQLAEAFPGLRIIIPIAIYTPFILYELFISKIDFPVGVTVASLDDLKDKLLSLKGQ